MTLKLPYLELRSVVVVVLKPSHKQSSMLVALLYPNLRSGSSLRPSPCGAGEEFVPLSRQIPLQSLTDRVEKKGLITSYLYPRAVAMWHLKLVTFTVHFTDRSMVWKQNSLHSWRIFTTLKVGHIHGAFHRQIYGAVAKKNHCIHGVFSQHLKWVTLTVQSCISQTQTDVRCGRRNHCIHSVFAVPNLHTHHRWSWNCPIPPVWPRKARGRTRTSWVARLPSFSS